MIKPWQNDDGSIYCPANAWDCPYYKEGKCTLEDVDIQCDDFYFFWGDEIEDFKDDEPSDIDDDCGFDPYMGCYTDDC